MSDDTREERGPHSPDDTPIEEFELSIRTSNRMAPNGYKTAGDVRFAEDEELLNIPGIGPLSLAELRNRVGKALK